ncbi:AbrB/MazE/SpoVT family DNA-binding domain-containing protein [Desulfatiferula olefinivorans]
MGIRLPSAVVEAFGLKEGDDIQVILVDPYVRCMCFR